MAFIVFTPSQAKNYVKRHPTVDSHDCGGDCCWSVWSTDIDGDKVILSHYGMVRDERFRSVNVVGRIKRSALKP